MGNEKGYSVFLPSEHQARSNLQWNLRNVGKIYPHSTEVLTVQAICVLSCYEGKSWTNRLIRFVVFQRRFVVSSACHVVSSTCHVVSSTCHVVSSTSHVISSTCPVLRLVKKSPLKNDRNQNTYLNILGVLGKESFDYL